MAQAQAEIGARRGLGSFASGTRLCGSGGGGALRRLIGIAAAAAVAIGGPALAQGQALEELRSRYPAVKTHDPHGRILTVWGAPMTRGETPREAAEEWVFWYGAVFGSQLDLDEFREVTLRNAPKGKERRVFMYRQQMGELPVVGSSFRVMTEGEPEGGGYGCENQPILFDLSDVFVTAYEESTAETLIAWAPTDVFGDYTLDFPTTTTAYVFAELKGPGWVVLDGTTAPSPTEVWSSEAAAPTPHVGNPVTTPVMGVDLLFNPTPTEKWTALVNAHKVMSKTVRWLDLAENAVPTVPVVAHLPGSCSGWFVPPHSTPPSWPGGGLALYQGSTFCDLYSLPVANAAYSTTIAHEYGHFIAWNFMGIDLGQSHAVFHEGFADTLAMLVFDTEVVGQDYIGCGEDLRRPRDSNPQYPRCGGEPCSTQHSGGAHCIAELLPALWRDMHDKFGDAAVRELFLDWITISQGPTYDACPGGTLGVPDQAADPGTLLEVLQVATDAQVPDICDVFELRGIEEPSSPCGDSAGRFCYADCNGDGLLDSWDVLCFQQAFITSDPYADCEEDGDCDFFDSLCFQYQFAAGCR